MWVAATLWGSIDARDLSTQAPWLGSGLPPCSGSTPLPHPSSQHSQGQATVFTPHSCAHAGLFAWNAIPLQPPPNSMENLVQISFLQDTQPPAPAALPHPPLAQSIIASSVFFCVSCCHSHHPAVVSYSLWCQQTMGILNTRLYSTLHPSDECPSHNTCTVNMCWVH